MDFDSVLELVDDFGTYQRLMLAFVLLPGFIPCGFHAYNQLFMAATPPHWCRVPALESTAWNFTLDQIKNLSLPSELREGRRVFSQCEMYDVRLDRIQHLFRPDDGDSGTDTLIKIYDEIERSQSQSGNLSWPIVPCQHGWAYDLSVYSSTVVTEWDVVCERSFLPTLALVLLGLGGLTGNYVFGNIQDSMGRRPAFFIYLSIQCFFGIATGFAFDFWSWLVIRIGVGFTVPAITGTPFVLALELVGPSKRTLCTILLNIAYSLCLMGLAGVAYLVRDWRMFAFSTSLPFTLFFVYWWILPESPRWLFAHGKLRETERILKRMAHINGKTLPRDFRKILQEKYSARRSSAVSLCPEDELRVSTASEGSRSYTVLDLLRGRVLRRNTIIITFIWFINMGVYVGLSYYAPALGGDEYLNFFLAGLAELPTYFFLYPCLDHWGRRWTLAASMILGGCACVSTILVKNEAWVTLTLYCIGKFGISAGFVAIQQMAAEIYPTVVRGLGISFSNVIGMIGPTLVPLVNYTGQEYLYLPLLTLGGLMVIGGVAGLGLPETLGTSLPQTLRDAESLQVDCSLQTCCPKRKQKVLTKIYEGVEGKEFRNEDEDRNSRRNLEQAESLLEERRRPERSTSSLQQRLSTSSV